MTRALPVRLARLGAALAAVALAACEPQIIATPVTPVPPLPPLLDTVFPAPRSARIDEQTEIWARFSVDLDTATVNSRTVFLKQDTRRLSADIRWEPATRRIRILPLVPLSLLRTYTVELTSAIRSAAGAPLADGFFWQFTILSVRRPQSPLPMHGAVNESPFAALRWGGLTEATVGAVRYDVHVANDSATAVEPSSPVAGSATSGLLVPAARWGSDRTLWWSVHAHNLTTGERRIGPAWRFQTLPAATPVDSVTPFPSGWAYYDANLVSNRLRCQLDSLVVHSSSLSVVRYQTGGPDSTLRVAAAYIIARPRRDGVTAEAGSSLWSVLSSSNDWTTCSMTSEFGPPFFDRHLADAEVIPGNQILYAGDRLSAHVEAMIRVGGLHGFILRSPRRISLWGASAISYGVSATQLRIVYYRRPFSTRTATADAAPGTGESTCPLPLPLAPR
jgi:hypothetical protein